VLYRIFALRYPGKVKTHKAKLADYERKLKEQSAREVMRSVYADGSRRTAHDEVTIATKLTDLRRLR
jgi:hypothetical protein